jgi:hypothetical protein
MHSSSHVMNRMILALVIFIVGLSSAAHAQPNLNTQYTAVIDAGSSGSRIYLYETRKTKTFIEIRSPELANARVTPGLSSYGEDTGKLSVTAAGTSLMPLLATLQDYLVANNIPKQEVPVYVMATAGMRQIDRQNPDLSRAIYRHVENTIKNEGYPLGTKSVAAVPGVETLGPIGTLSGQNEALFGWLDVNYLMGNFDTNAQTVGIVEMGGASAQVAYSVPENFSNPNILKQVVNGRTHYVFAISYLDLGLDQALRTALAKVPEGNPCFVSGTPRAAGGLPSSTDRFDFEICRNLFFSIMAPFFSSNAPLPSGSGFEEMRFAGIGAIPAKFARWNASPNTLRTAPDEDISKLPDAVEVACTPNNWDLFLQWFNGPKEFANDLCAHSTYLHAFLFGARVGTPASVASLGLFAAQLKSIAAIKQTPASWTRGLIVAITN